MKLFKLRFLSSFKLPILPADPLDRCDQDLREVALSLRGVAVKTEAAKTVMVASLCFVFQGLVAKDTFETPVTETPQREILKTFNSSKIP